MSFNTTRMAAGMNAAAATITHVAWSENGTTESTNLARTAAIGALAENWHQTTSAPV